MDVEQPATVAPLPVARRPFSVGYVYDIQMQLHRAIHGSPDGHPEEPERISHIYSLLVANKLISQMKEIPCREAIREEILLVHSEDHWDKVQALACTRYRSSNTLST